VVVRLGGGCRADGVLLLRVLQERGLLDRSLALFAVGEEGEGTGAAPLRVEVTALTISALLSILCSLV